MSTRSVAALRPLHRPHPVIELPTGGEQLRIPRPVGAEPALTVRVVSIGAISHVFGMAIQFFGGTVIPVTIFPHAMQIAVRFLPTTLGVQAVNITLTGRGLGAAWSDGALPWLRDRG